MMVWDGGCVQTYKRDDLKPKPPAISHAQKATIKRRKLID